MEEKKQQMGQAVGRMAPSPTGRMHPGNVLSFLLAWLSVRSQKGRMILRLEDLDPQRSRLEYCRQLEDDLRWLGLDWEEGGLEDRPDYRQSNCGALYRQALEILEEKGLLYPCFCSRDELHAASAPHRSDGTVLYPGSCRGLSAEERRQRMALRSPSLRIRVPEETIEFTDRHYGLYRENLAEECGDFILRRSDGVCAYQLAVVVDDERMGVTEIVRGCDLLDSTPRQIWLRQQLNYSQPEYAHVPLLVAADGRRLSKRDRDMDLGRLRSLYRPEELLGSLACAAGLLDRYEPVSAKELIPLFAWEKIKKENFVLTLPPAE